MGITLPNDPDVRALSAIVNRPGDQIDFANAKLTIDRMIDPSVNSKATLKLLDVWMTKIRARIPSNASHLTKLMILGSTLYQPGPWNDYKPVSYDFNDPFGHKIQNKLLYNYLVTRKGNCVSMPTLLLILGQKLGLNVTLAHAPNHDLLMFRQDNGKWIDIEATSGTSFSDGDYERQLHISPLAIRTGIYLRPLSPKEVVGLMMTTLEEFYAVRRPPEYQLGLTALGLQINPRDSDAMIWRGDAYDDLLRQRYVSKYPQPKMIPPRLRGDFRMLTQNNLGYFHQAETLGWHQPTATEDAEYLHKLQQAKKHWAE